MRNKPLMRLAVCLIGMAALVLQSCADGGTDRDRLCGSWTSVDGKPDVLVYKEGEAYKVTVFARSGKTRRLRPQTYLLVEENGNLFINTGVPYRCILQRGDGYPDFLTQRGLCTEGGTPMRARTFLIGIMLVLGGNMARAQWVVTDPGNLAQSIINMSDNIAHTSKTAVNTADNFAETVKIYEQAKKYYDQLKAVNNLIQDARKVRDIILMVGDVSDIYVTNFKKMMNDDNFSSRELDAIAFGYTRLLEESNGVLQDLKQVINVSTLSMTDKDRMDVVDNCYYEMRRYRNLVSYYTNKNIAVSYLRARKKNDMERVMRLYGNETSKYW